MRSPLIRVSRRTLLTDFGAAGVGLIVLGACGSDSSTSSNDPEARASTPPVSDPATAETTATTNGSEPASTSGSSPGGSGELQLEHVSLGFVSAYVLARGNEAAIVDTGQGDSRQAILDGVSALSLAPSDVRHIVLTHNHGDHIGGLGDLEGDLTNATVYIGTQDADPIQTSLELVTIEDGDEVFGMGVVGTPGHTPGSISLFETASGILVAGDAIRGDESGGILEAPPDFTPDKESAAMSIEKLAALMPSVAAFGHGGPPVTDDVAAKLAAIG